MFTNSISTGMILGGVIQGTLSERLGYEAVYWLALVLAIAALIMSAWVRDV